MKFFSPILIPPLLNVINLDKEIKTKLPELDCDKCYKKIMELKNDSLDRFNKAQFLTINGVE